MRTINQMKLEFSSIPENEGFARVAVSAFAVQLNPTLDVPADSKTAVSEAVTNAIVHGYAEHAGITNAEYTFITKENAHTEDILEQLNDAGTQAALKDADYVIFSVGLYDVMDPYIAQAEEYRIPCDTVLDLMYMDAPEKDGLQLTWILEDGTGIENDVLFVDRDMTVTAVYAE